MTRIHGELLELGTSVSESTVAECMVRGGDPRRSQTWRSFLRNHSRELGPIDLLAVRTAPFATLCGVLVPAHDRRRMVQRMTADPCGAYVSHPMSEACPWDTQLRLVIGDRDLIDSPACRSRVSGAGIDDHPSQPGILGEIRTSLARERAVPLVDAATVAEAFAPIVARALRENCTLSRDCRPLSP